MNRRYHRVELYIQGLNDWNDNTGKELMKVISDEMDDIVFTVGKIDTIEIDDGCQDTILNDTRFNLIAFRQLEWRAQGEQKGEYPDCVSLCATQRTITDCEASCRRCELRTKKAKDIDPPSTGFFEE